jgi:hypothetical protein
MKEIFCEGSLPNLTGAGNEPHLSAEFFMEAGPLKMSLYHMTILFKYMKKSRLFYLLG